MTGLTQQDVNAMKTMLDNNNRTGMYIYYYEHTGSQQALEQAKISSFSGLVGGTALHANAVIETMDRLFGDNVYPPSVVEFSNQIASGLFNQIKDNVNNGGDGVFSDGSRLLERVIS